MHTETHRSSKNYWLSNSSTLVSISRFASHTPNFRRSFRTWRNFCWRCRRWQKWSTDLSFPRHSERDRRTHSRRKWALCLNGFSGSQPIRRRDRLCIAHRNLHVCALNKSRQRMVCRNLTVWLQACMRFSLRKTKTSEWSTFQGFDQLVGHRGIEPRSTPSESATLSVELMTHKSLPR